MSGKKAIRSEKLEEFCWKLKFSVEPVVYDFFEVQFEWGLRHGDCLNLSVKDALYVLQHGQIHLGEQKTGKSRCCSLNSVVEEIFRRRISGATLWDGMVHRVNYAKKLKMVAEQCGIDPGTISTHSVRKTFATCLRDEGVSIEKISEQMEHSSIAITRRYAGFDDEEKFLLTSAPRVRGQKVAVKVA
jgi:integrase